jgi:hypothetical protein
MLDNEWSAGVGSTALAWLTVRAEAGGRAEGLLDVANGREEEKCRRVSEARKEEFAESLCWKGKQGYQDLASRRVWVRGGEQICRGRAQGKRQRIGWRERHGVPERKLQEEWRSGGRHAAAQHSGPGKRSNYSPTRPTQVTGWLVAR